MKIYLAGAITNKDPKVQQSNVERFYAKARELRQIGLKVYCPPENEPQGLRWEEYIAMDIPELLKCSHIYLMKGWQSSKGAALEHAIARRENIEVIYEV